MSKVTDTVNILFSSTAESKSDAYFKAYERVCKSLEVTHHIKIHTKKWDINVAGGTSGRTGQDRIDEAIKDSYDIYFGCLGAKYGSGTVHEFEDAIRGHIENDDPMEVLFGFDESRINPFELSEDFFKVKRFRADLQTDEKYGKSILYFTFSNSKEFEDKVLLNVDGAIKKIKDRVRGGIRFGSKKP